jgi:GTP-binding nuclear protein Ran
MASLQSSTSTSRISIPPTFKLVLVGDGGVGKTVMLRKFQTDTFNPKYIATLGVEVEPITLSNNVRFNCWDTAGQEKFGGLRAGYYIQAHCAFVMLDLTSRLTLKNVPHWIRDVKQMAPDAKIIVLGNKKDCVSSRKVSAEQVRSYIGDAFPYFEISAKTGEGIKDAFQVMSTLVAPHIYANL